MYKVEKVKMVEILIGGNCYEKYSQMKEKVFLSLSFFSLSVFLLLSLSIFVSLALSLSLSLSLCFFKI